MLVVLVYQFFPSLPPSLLRGMSAFRFEALSLCDRLVGRVVAGWFVQRGEEAFGFFLWVDE